MINCLHLQGALAAAISLTTPNGREKISWQHHFDGEGYECDTFLKGPLSFLFIGGLEHTEGGNTLCGLGQRHSNRWLDTTARGPLFFFVFFFQFGLPDPMIPIWVSVRAAIHHWLDYLVGWEQKAIHLCSWHSPGQRDAVLPAPPQNNVLQTHSHANTLGHRCMRKCASSPGCTMKYVNYFNDKWNNYLY